jgi:hypothetical protein
VLPTRTDQVLAAALGVALDDLTAPLALSRSVPHSPDLERVLVLPRRDWWHGIGGRFGDAASVRELLSEHLRLPGSTARLRLVQSAALQEAADFGGLLAPVVVGGGKTLLSLLLPQVVGAEAPMLILRSALIAKTLREREGYARDWRVPRLVVEPDVAGPGEVLVVAYESLSRESRATLLWERRPDHVVADEAHRLRNLRAGRTRRVARYVDDVRAGRVPGRTAVRFYGMTGTIAKRSMRDYAHLLDWALGPGSPLPRKRDRLEEWCAALDEGAASRVAVGALARLCSAPEEQEELRVSPLIACRRAFGRRLRQTPGVVVASSDEGVGAKLRVRALHLAPDAAQAAALRRLREDWETPGGEPFATAADLWRHGRELAQGFYYRWREPAPEDWLAARRDWCRFVREALRSRRARDGQGGRLDTELQVANACRRGDLDRSAWDAWDAVRAKFKPRTEAVWISDAALQVAARWLEAHPRGIAWVEQPESVGRRLSEITGLPCFGEGGFDAAGRYIEDAAGPIIASIGSNGEGRNLQFRWSDNLALSWPQQGQACEQLLGRTHRGGQPEGLVSAEVLLACREAYESFLASVSDAEYLGLTTAVPQKLTTADVLVRAPDPAPPGW